MALYVKYSTWIYEVYLKYIAPEDIHVYSIDEVFLDVSHYLRIYRMSVRELAGKIVKDVFETTGGYRDQSLLVQGCNGYRGKACTA